MSVNYTIHGWYGLYIIEEVLLLWTSCKHGCKKIYYCVVFEIQLK